MNVTILSGSSRNPNLSHRIALMLEKNLNTQHPQNSYSILDIRNFPLGFIENVWMKKEDMPADQEALGKFMFDADAFILVSPEYNGSYSAVMKNLLDHFPKFNKRAFGIVTYSPGVMGGMRAAQQMQQMICAFFGVPSPHMLLIGNAEKKIAIDGEIIDEPFLKNVHGFCNEFVWLAEALFEKKTR